MRCSLLLALACALALARPSRGTAEVVVAPSLEWLIASSDVVVRGRIADVTLGPASLDVPKWDKVTVRVAETLRGKKQDSVSFVVPQPSGEFGTLHLRHLQENNIDVLFMLIRSDEHKKTGPPPFIDVELTPRRQSQPFDLSGKYAFVVPTMDFKALTRPDDLLKSARAVAKAVGDAAAPKRMALHVPSGSDAFHKLWAGSSVLMEVPVDAQLEARAQVWLNAKGVPYRTLGARALSNFKSDKNIASMKLLLQSADSEEYSTEGKRFRAYPLRAAAFEALTNWGVVVERPVTQELLK